MTSPLEAGREAQIEASHRSWWLAFGVSLGTALLIVSPFFRLGIASGHDISFHASSWLDAAGQWKEGIVYPRWTEWANYGFGEPRFVFYPPLSWMLGAALCLVLPGNAVPGVFIVLVQTLAGLSMFALARRFVSAGAAVFAAAAYAANPYALLIVYMRSDFAEELAAVFLPLLLLAALQVSGLVANRWRSQARAVAAFAGLFAAIWLSNAPAGVMAGYSMALLLAWAALRQKSFAPLWRGAAGLALGFGLVGFYLLPAAYEQRWVNIGQALSSGLQPSQNFLFTRIDDADHNLFNWIASSVAVLQMALTGAAALIAYRDRKRSETSALIAYRDGESSPGGAQENKPWSVFLLLGAAAIILMLRSSSILWAYLPKLQFVQFPWRWLGILAVPYAYFSAMVAQRRRTGWVWAAIVLIGLTGTGIFLVHKTWWDSDDIPSLQDAIANGQGFEGTDEYDPLGDDHYDLQQNTPRARALPAENSQGALPQAQVRVERWTAEDKRLRVDSSKPLRLAVRLLDFPAWQVEVNGQKLSAHRLEGSGQITVGVPAGTSIIRIRFTTTPDRILGDVLSSASLLLALAAVFSRTASPRAA